jgi:hypothetical protein
MQPEPARAVAFHAVWLVGHGAATWLLYRCLFDRFGSLPSGLAALFFGTLPGIGQAVGWIVAGGDMLIVVFTLLGIRILQRAGSPATVRADLAAAACMLAAGLSKESAPALLPGVVVAAVAIGGRRPLAWTRLIVFLAASVALSQLFRAQYFGGPTGIQARMSAHSLGEFARGVGDALVGVATSRLTASSVETPTYVSALTPILGNFAPTVLRCLPLLAIALPVLVGCIVARGRRRASFAILAGVFFGALTPAAVVLANSGVGELSGRIYYSAAAALAALVACALASLEAAGLRPIDAVLLLAPHALIQADLWVHTVAGELQRGDAVRSRIDSLRTASKAADPNILFVAIDPVVVDQDRPMLGYDVEFVLSPPFHRPRRGVTWAPTTELIDTLACFRGDPRPVQVFVVEGERFVPLGKPLDGPASAPPKLVADPNDPLRFTLSHPVPGRSAAAVRFDALEATPGAVAKCVWLTPGRERSTAIGEIAAAPNDSAWLLEPSIVGVRFEGARSVSIPTLLATLPRIEIVEPRQGANVRLTSAILVIRTPPRATSYRLVVRPIGPLTLDAMRASIDLSLPSSAGSQVSIPMRGVGPVTSMQLKNPLPAEQVWLALETVAANALRRDQRRMEIRIEALAPDGVTVEAASPWTLVFLETASER